MLQIAKLLLTEIPKNLFGLFVSSFFGIRIVTPAFNHSYICCIIIIIIIVIVIVS